MEINKTLESIREETINMEEKRDPIYTQLVEPKKKTEEI